MLDYQVTALFKITFTLACRQGKNGALAVFFQVYTAGKTLVRAVAQLLECSDAELFSAPMAVLVEQIHAGHSCEAHQCFCWNKKRFFSCPSLLVFLWRYCHHIKLSCQWEKSQSCVAPHSAAAVFICLQAELAEK